MIKKFFLIKKEGGMRIDKFLKNQFPELSRNWLQKMIREKLINVNDRETEPRYLLKNGDKVFVSLHEKKQVKVSPNNSIKLWIVFENEDFLVINKQAGILVHPNYNPNIKTLVSGLLSYYPQLKNVGEHPLRPGLVHRLDKETSGLLLVAKNQETFLDLKSLFKQRKIEKTYKALVFGYLKDHEGKIESYLSRSHKNSNARISLAKPRNNLRAKKAITYYQVEQRLIDQNNTPYTLLSLFPKTGRTHQLRAQLASINHPIAGDYLYTNKLYSNKNNKKLLLHAEKLAFTFKNHYYQFYSPINQYFKMFISHLKNAVNNNEKISRFPEKK